MMTGCKGSLIAPKAATELLISICIGCGAPGAASSIK